MKYFVTGGLGVIGSRFAEIMLRAGHTVTIMDAAEEPRNLWMAEKLQNTYKNVSIFKERMEKANLRIVEGHDFILHAAAHTGIPHSADDPDDDWVSNVDATRCLLETLRMYAQDIPTVMLSSVKPYKIDHLPCYSDPSRTLWAPGVAVDETFQLEPDEPYAASKMAQSALGMAYAKSYDLPVTVLRCSNLYGDAPCHGPRHGWLTWFCIAAAIRYPIELQGTGQQTRDMLFSDDVASAVLAAYEQIDELSGHVYNIGGGVNNTISCTEAIGYIVKYLGKTIDLHPKPGRKNEDMVFITNHGKFTSETGWRPKIDVKTGIARILDWACANADDLMKLYDKA